MVPVNEMTNEDKLCTLQKPVRNDEKLGKYQTLSIKKILSNIVRDIWCCKQSLHILKVIPILKVIRNRAWSVGN